MAPKRVSVICDLGTDYDDVFMAIQAFMDDADGIISLDMLGVNRTNLLDRLSIAVFLKENTGNRTTTICAGIETHVKGDEVKEYAKIKRPDGKNLNPADFANISDHLIGLIEDCHAKGQTMSIVNTTSFTDLADVLRKLDQSRYKYIEAIHAQGLSRLVDGIAVPDAAGVNNSFDMHAAGHVYEICRQSGIKLNIYNKHAATKTKIDPSILAAVENVYPAIGSKLRGLFYHQEKDFYKRACLTEPSERYRPFMDVNWYLKFKTVWDKETLPKSFDELFPYVKAVLYDHFAIVGASTGGAGVFRYQALGKDISEVGASAVDDESCLRKYFLRSLYRQAAVVAE